MPSNVWNDALGGTDELSLEEIMFRLQEIYRSASGSSSWGRPYKLDDYDGLDPNMHIQAQDSVESLFMRMENFDSAVSYQGDNDGHAFEGPWGFTGDGTIDGNVAITGDVDIDGTLHATGAVVFDNTLHTIGAVDFDSTLNVDSAVTAQTTVHVIGALTADANVTLGDAAADALLVKATSTFNENATFVKDVIVQGNTTLGNANTDLVTVTGTATFAEDVTMTKGLIVDTTTLVVDETLDKVGIGKVPTSTDCKLTVVGVIESTDWVVPTSGESIIMSYIPASHLGLIRSANHGTSVYQNLFIDGAGITIRAPVSTGSIDLQVNSASKIKADNTGIGFFATAPVAKQTITGSRAGNAALADLLTKLAATGLITNSSSA